MSDVLTQLGAQLGVIFYTIVLPVLLLAAVGYALQRRLGLDMPTLKRLNFYFVIPAMIYFSLVTSNVSGEAVLIVVGFTLAMQALNALATYAACVLRGVPADQRAALLMTVMYHNSGNYGLPLQDLAFQRSGLGARAMSQQVFVMVTQNFTSFTIGILLAAGGGRDRRLSWRENLLHIVKFPPIYALLAALVTVQIRNALPADAARSAEEALAPLWQVLIYVKNAFLGVALCTLGAQLATVQRGGLKYPVRLSVVLRLLVAPATGLVIIYLAGIEGFLAQMLLISTCTPTAVNCMLLCLEFDNHPDFAARAVFYSTLLSPITVTLTIFLAQSGLLPGFAM